MSLNKDTKPNQTKPNWLSGKGKVVDTAVCKEGHADYLLGQQKTQHYWFLL